MVDFFVKDEDYASDIVGELKKFSSDRSALVIFDDMLNSNNLDQVAELFSVESRHNNISAIFLTQKLFLNNDYFRQISQNSDYFVIFKNPRNSSEIRALSSQMTPGSMDLIEIYKEATQEPFSYLFINVTQECQLQVKYISSLFKTDGIVIAYVFTNCRNK